MASSGNELSTRLLTDDSDLTHAWRDLLELAVEVADADGATISLVDARDPDKVHVPAAVAALSDWEGRETPAEGSITRAALEAGEAIAIPDAAEDPRTTGVAQRAPHVASVLSAPLVFERATEPHPRAVLTLTRRRGAGGFDPLDARIVTGFASQAATALTLSQSRRDRARLKELEDREQLLGELNNTILSGLMRVTFMLSSAANRADPELRRLLVDQVHELDGLSRSLRDTVLHLSG